MAVVSNVVFSMILSLYVGVLWWWWCYLNRITAPAHQHATEAVVYTEVNVTLDVAM